MSLREIPTCPTLEPSDPPKRKNRKGTIPNSVVSFPESRQLLLDEKLMRVRQLAKQQKKIEERKWEERRETKENRGRQSPKGIKETRKRGKERKIERKKERKIQAATK